MNIRQPNLFHRVIMEDGAPTARAVPPPTDPFVNQQFNEFLQSAGCANETDSSKVFPCLRALSAEAFAKASVTIFNNYNPSVRWPFQPVVDGELIRLRPTEEWESGDWNKVPILTGFATDEGSIFAPRALNTSAGFTDFFKTLIPAFDTSDLDELNSLYPDPLTDPASPYTDTRPIPVGKEYKRATAALGQSSYICNIMTTVKYASQSTPPVWLWHWATNVSLTTGAAHTSHTPYESYELFLRQISSTQDAIAQDVTAYWTSFIATGDPNKVRVGLGKDRPEWKMYHSVEGGTVMLLGQGNDERAGGTELGVVAQMVKNEEFEKECAFWNARAVKLLH
jgi:acetylcholinesterase